MNIPADIQAALAASQGLPLEVVDPNTNERYVLIRAETYEALVSGKQAGTRFALREMGRRADWDDPSMDAYDALDPRK
ncbi:MAG: hypothetical protein AB7U73_09215 [Pirellulales bacterium]